MKSPGGNRDVLFRSIEANDFSMPAASVYWTLARMFRETADPAELSPNERAAVAARFAAAIMADNAQASLAGKPNSPARRRRAMEKEQEQFTRRLGALMRSIE